MRYHTNRSGKLIKQARTRKNTYTKKLLTNMYCRVCETLEFFHQQAGSAHITLAMKELYGVATCSLRFLGISSN